MIECHKCHNYFHGNCVGISRQKASLLKHFYCPLCIDEDPDLVTEFDSKVEKEVTAEQAQPEERGARKLKNKRHNRR